MPPHFVTPKKARKTGFSLPELMIAVACTVVVGGFAAMVYLNTLGLSRKNGAINANHESVRKVLDRLQKEIQSAISIPALVGTNRDVIDSTGPAPGIAFLRQSGPIRRVVANANAGSTVIQLDSGPAVTVGQRLLLPSYDIEGDVISVNGTTVTLATSLPIDVKVTSGGVSRTVTAVITDLISYVVVNGQLREYQNAATNNYNVVAIGLTEPSPFGLPYNAVPNGTPSS